MHNRNKLLWLAVPPSLALVLFLGPLSAPAKTQAPQPATQVQPAVSLQTPSLTQVVSTLLGVLLLGGVGVAVLARYRRSPAAHQNGPASLRQTVRLSPRHNLHVVQFEDRLLLIGECDGNLTLLHGANPSDDEGEVAARAHFDDDDGAVPKDLLIPKPARKLPAQPRTAAAATPAAAPRSGLADFRKLLDMARTGAKAR